LVDNDAVTDRCCEDGFAFAYFQHFDGECFASKYWGHETTFNVLEAICIAANGRRFMQQTKDRSGTFLIRTQIVALHY
jgi:hypothetical protein